jgi:hypothetical protein
MTMPDRIQITHQPRTMTTPTIRTAMTSDDIPPGPLSEDDLRQRWNQQTDEHNQWESLDSCEQLAWAQALAIKADRHAAALKAKPEEQRPSETDLYDLAAEFNGDPVPAMRRALELWGNPLRGAPAPGENLATPPFPEPGEAKELHPLWYLVEFLEGHSSFCRQTEPTDELAQILSDSATLLQQQEAELAALRGAPGPTFQDAIRLAQGCHDYSGGHSGAEGEAWHGAIDTVADVLKRAAAGPWDSQIRAVYGVGVEAGAGEVALAGDRRSAESLQLAHESCRLLGTKNDDCPDSGICWLDTLPCSHYENCATPPAPQAGEVEA